MTVPTASQHDGAQQEPEDFEQQLLKYQKRIANILESFTDAFFEVDGNWTVTYWNKEAERLLDKPRDQIIGLNLWEVYADAVPLKFFEEYHRARDQNIAVRFEEYFGPKNIWLEVAAFPSGDGLSVYFKDISSSKENLEMLMRERQKYSDLFNLSPVPQWVYDADTLQFLDVNEAAIGHYGYSREEFLSMTIKDIRPESDLELLQQTLRTQITPGILNKSMVRHQKKNGDIISVLVEGNSIFFEGRTARLVMVVDRTTEIEAAEAAKIQTARLQEISWIQSHKVRSPLASILGLISLIEINKDDSDAIQESIPLLKVSAEELDCVLKEILQKI